MRRNKKHGPSPPSGMWTGTISFGLVSVPVSLFPALRRRAVHLRMLAPDGTPLARQYVCSKDGKPLEAKDLVRGYETDEGKVVLVEDKELEELAPEKSHDISLTDFVEVKAIDPFLFDRPYFLVPAGGSSKAYRLLAHVMEKQGRAGIASFVMRGNEYLVAIIAQGGLLSAETLRFVDELRRPDDIGLPQRHEVEEGLLRRMTSLVTGLRKSEVDKGELDDRYAARFEDLVRRKRKIRKAVVATKVLEEGEEESDVMDLVALFRERMKEAAA